MHCKIGKDHEAICRPTVYSVIYTETHSLSLKRLDYATVVLQYLMVEMIDNCRDDQLMTLMRSSGTICEKMLSFWFAMLMHRTLFERTGNYIYRLFEAVKSWTYNQPGMFAY